MEFNQTERNILILITKGYTNKEIAVELHYATNTIKQYVKDILCKTGMHSRTQLAVMVIAAWLRHVDRLDEIPGARLGLPHLNPLWDASFALEKTFEGEKT